MQACAEEARGQLPHINGKGGDCWNIANLCGCLVKDDGCMVASIMVVWRCQIWLYDGKDGGLLVMTVVAIIDQSWRGLSPTSAINRGIH